MNNWSAKIATICECIDHCFAFIVWCDDFARFVDQDDIVWGLDRGFDLVSDATRLHSFLDLRKLDDIFGGAELKPDDLVALGLGLDVSGMLDEVGESFLTSTERVAINKGVAHLTDRLSLDTDSEVALDEIVKRSIPVFSRLVTELRKNDTAHEATHWLDRTEKLIQRVNALWIAEDQMSASSALLPLTNKT